MSKGVSKFFAYLVINTINNKKYIGITSRTVDERWHEHVLQSKSKIYRSLFQKAISKYGEDKFIKIILCEAKSWLDICDLEKILIVQHNTKAPFGYNLTSGGDGVYDLPDEIRKEISAKNRGRKHSEEAKQKIGLGGKGRVVSIETRRKISIGHKGKKLSQEHIEKMTASKRGKLLPHSLEHNRKISEGLCRAWSTRKAV